MRTLLERDCAVHHPPENGCVFSLTGLPGSGNAIQDRSPYGNNGVITGACWVKLAGGLWCLSYDGIDDIVTVADCSPLDITSGDMTVMLWLCPGAIDRYCDVLQKGTGNGSYTLYISGTPGPTLNTIQFLKQGTPGLVSVTRVSTGAWLSVTATKRAGTARLFINAVLEAESDSFPDFTDMGDLRIGRGDDGFFAGCISLPRIYNRALSALEIQNLYHREKDLLGVC